MASGDCCREEAHCRRCRKLEEKLERAERLLCSLMPAPVVTDLLRSEAAAARGRSKRALVPGDGGEPRFWKREEGLDSQKLGLSKSTRYDHVTVFFSDIAGFTAMSQTVEPDAVMAFLHDLYSGFDEVMESHPTLWKVETIGDSYMVAGGLMQLPGRPQSSEAVARDVVEFAKQALRVAGRVTLPNGEACKLRVGVHTGPVCTGVVGSKMPRYCLFGDTVNTASRMESTGSPGAVQVSASTWALLGDDEGSGWRKAEVVAKGKGTMETHILQVLQPRPSKSPVQSRVEESIDQQDPPTKKLRV